MRRRKRWRRGERTSRQTPSTHPRELPHYPSRGLYQRPQGRIARPGARRRSRPPRQDEKPSREPPIRKGPRERGRERRAPEDRQVHQGEDLPQPPSAHGTAPGPDGRPRCPGPPACTKRAARRRRRRVRDRLERQEGDPVEEDGPGQDLPAREGAEEAVQGPDPDDQPRGEDREVDRTWPRVSGQPVPRLATSFTRKAEPTMAGPMRKRLLRAVRRMSPASSGRDLR